MSIEDEIRAKKEIIQAEMRKQEYAAQQAERLRNARNAAGMHENTPVLMIPSSELHPVITEALPQMKFTHPKIVRKMPDGYTYARESRNNERADACSFDAFLFSDGDGKGSSQYYIWIFDNGAIAFVRNQTNCTWEEVKNTGIGVAAFRTKIIEALAKQEMKASTSSGGCYIATAVYGSYDCPEVWVLRRFRDFYLKRFMLGRVFIRLYYTISPKFVKWFGKKSWFILSFRKFLDKKVKILKEKGFSDKEYMD